MGQVLSILKLQTRAVTNKVLGRVRSQPPARRGGPASPPHPEGSPSSFQAPTASEPAAVTSPQTAQSSLAPELTRAAVASAPAPALPPSLSIVNRTGNVTYNLGRDVVNNSYVNNYFQIHETTIHDSNLDQLKTVMRAIKTVLGENFVSDAADDEQSPDTGCMPGTRQEILALFIAWAKEDPKAIFWLAGMAGTGKTSIAVSLCRMLRNDSDVIFGGGFFCSRSAGGIPRSDVRRILPTLATLLAGESAEFAESLSLELNKDQRVGHKPVADQIGPLLRTPLAALASSTRPIVFVVDALDECSDERELSVLLRQLAGLECAAKVKFIFASRPEMHIRGTPISSPDHNTILHLHTINKSEVASDIRFYFRERLASAAPEATWYTDDDVDLLVKLSDGLFIFASTVLDFVLSREGDEDRHDRLLMVTSAVVNSSAARGAIDEIYELILMEATKSKAVEPNELERLRQVLACILTARASLSIDTLASLIGMTSGRLRGSLERLHSLVYLPSDNKQTGVRTLHASFGDYLFERAPQHIWIAPSLGHDILARGCLSKMVDLHFNIARSQSSFVPNPDTVPDWIPLTLIYACLHWAHHIDAASDSSAFDGDVHGSFIPKFLFWLEVLSVTHKMGVASGLLRIAYSAAKQGDLAQFIRDAIVFVASSQAAISKSAPHIYVSALQFTHQDSLIYRNFAPLRPSIVSIDTIDTDYSGGRLLMTLSHGGRVNSIAYSRDGCMLASGSDDGTARIWSTLTGEEIMSPLRSDGGVVMSVTFAPNDRHVILGTAGGVVDVWNITTGRPALPPLLGHSDVVRSVGVSPDGALIASASQDATVRLWRLETGREVSIITAHTNWVYCVAFSPNGRFLASASKDQTVRLWSLTGEAIGEPLTSLQDEIRSLAFSSDGRYLSAGSYNTLEARVWDLETLHPTPAAIKHPASVFSLAFSPHGLKLASASYNTIRFWDPQTGQEVPGTSLTGHSGWIRSIAFSPDGVSLASGSADHTVRIWDIVRDDESTVRPPQMHFGTVFSAVVSSDGTFMVSGSGDRTVRIWNALTGEAMFQPLQGHQGSIYQVAISADARLIASASADHTVRLWNAKLGEAIGQPLLGHKSNVNSVAFSPDGKWLASGSHDATVNMWDVATGKPLTLDCARRIYAVAFSPDGRLLAAGDHGGYLHFWQSGTNQPARTALSTDDSEITSIAFSPDATRIVSGTWNHAVFVCDIKSGRQDFVFRPGFVGNVRSVACSPEGRYIVSASGDNHLRLWDARTGELVKLVRGHGDSALSVAFTPDGMSMVSSGSDKTIRVWNVEQVLSPLPPAEHDPLARFTPAAVRNDGWLVGSSGELLLWLPMAYLGCVQLPPCTMIIGPHRISVGTNDLENGLSWGEKWTACWRGGA